MSTGLKVAVALLSITLIALVALILVMFYVWGLHVSYTRPILLPTLDRLEKKYGIEPSSPAIISRCEAIIETEAQIKVDALMQRNPNWQTELSVVQIQEIAQRALDKYKNPRELERTTAESLRDNAGIFSGLATKLKEKFK